MRISSSEAVSRDEVGTQTVQECPLVKFNLRTFYRGQERCKYSGLVMCCEFLQREFSNKLQQHLTLFDYRAFLKHRQQDENNEENHSLDATLRLRKELAANI